MRTSQVTIDQPTTSGAELTTAEKVDRAIVRKKERMWTVEDNWGIG
jgi:hypothetical protein